MKENLIAPAPTPAVPPAALLTAIGAKIADLREQDKARLAEQLTYERAGVRPQEPKPGPDARSIAEGMLNGFAESGDREPTEGEKLHALLIERAGIRMAIETLDKREMQTRILALNALLQETGKEWRTIVRRRVLAVLALHEVNCEAAAFRARLWRLAGMDPRLSCDPQGGIFAAILGGPVYQFIETCRKAGIVTRQEIAAASDVRVSK